MSYRRLDGIAGRGGKPEARSLLPRGRAWRWLWLGVAESDSPSEARRVVQANVGALLMLLTTAGYLAVFAVLFSPEVVRPVALEMGVTIFTPLVWWLNAKRRLLAARWALAALAIGSVWVVIVAGQGTVLSTQVYFLLFALVAPTIFGAQDWRAVLVVAGICLSLFGYFSWVGIAPHPAMDVIPPAMQVMAERSVQVMGAITMLVMILLMEAASADTERRLHGLAHTDALTELHNRRYFMDQLAREFRCAAREHAPLSVAVIDIDHFKAVNDTLGHEAGDDALRHVASTLQRNVRPSDWVARLGGEEFGWLLPHTSVQEACQAAERVRAVLAQSPWVYRGDAHRLTVSIGVAAAAPGADCATVLAHADQALYEAKGAGRNCVRLAADPAAVQVPAHAPEAASEPTPHPHAADNPAPIPAPT